MQRPKLEIASWVAGIIAAAAALVALAYQIAQPSQSLAPTSATAGTTLSAQPERAATEAATTPNAAVSEYRQRLHSGLEAAKRLNNYTEREEAILKIVRAAIKDDYYLFAHEASRSLNVYANRDAVAVAVSCHLAHRGEYDSAKGVALSINDYRVRDKSLSLISSLAAIRPGQGENGYSCSEA